MSHLFNERLELGESLTSIWRKAMPINPELKYGMRYWEPANLLLRSHDSLDIGSKLETTRTLEFAAAHFKKLGQLGLSIISHTQEPRADLRPAKQRRWEIPIAYSASIWVPHSQSLEESSKNSICEEAVLYQVVKPLKLYLGWSVLSRQPYILSDIYRHSQYSIDLSSATIFLHDIDPLIQTTDEESIEQVNADLRQFLR